MENNKDKSKGPVPAKTDDRDPQGLTQTGEGQYERDEQKESESDGYNKYSGNSSNLNPDDDGGYSKNTSGNGRFADENNTGDYDETGARGTYEDDAAEEDDILSGDDNEE